MKRVGVLRRWWRSNVVCDASLRTIFYRLLAAQSRSGVSLLRACRSLAGQTHLNQVLRMMGKSGADALATGRLASDGWRESGYLPMADCGVLGVAEQSGSLLDALGGLADPAQRVPTFTRDVLRPNLGQWVPLVIALSMTVASPTVLGRIAADTALLDGVPLYEVATRLIAFGPAMVLVAGCLVATIAFGRTRWHSARRRLFSLFSRDWLAQLAIRYCRLAADMTREGATHRQTLMAFREVATGSYTSTAIPKVERDLLDGRSYAASLSGRLMPVELASLLEAFSPGDDRARYPSAFASLADIQSALLHGTYQVWARALKVLLMCTSAGLILLLIHGLLDVTRNLTQQIGMGF